MGKSLWLCWHLSGRSVPARCSLVTLPSMEGNGETFGVLDQPTSHRHSDQT